MQQHQQINNNNECDIPFFKVFKNVYIRKLIFKFIKYPIYTSIQFNFNNYTYDQCKSVEWMIGNNHLQMLKEKVYSGENLIFNFQSNDLLKKNCSVFSVFKDDQKFFNKLFENYSEFFQLSNSIQNLEIVERFIIENDNLSALKVIIEKYKFKPTIKSFTQSFELNSFKLSEYLYISHFSNQVTQEEKDYLWTSSFGKSSVGEILDRANHLINQLGIPIQKSSIDNDRFLYISNKIINEELYYSTTKVVIDSLKVITHIKPLSLSMGTFKAFTMVTDKCKNDLSSFLLQQQQSNSLDLSIDQLNEIESKLTLSNNLSTRIIEFDKSNKQVESLIKMYLRYSNIGKIFNNWILYKIIYYGDYQIDDQSILQPFKFGEWVLSESNIDIQNVFKYIINQEKIKQFIDKELQHQQTSGNTNKRRLNCILSYLISKQDENSFQLLEEISVHPLIKKVSPSLFPTISKELNLSPLTTYSKIYEYIKTIEKFEIVYYFNQSLFDPKTFLVILQNYEIISHFKNNYTKRYYKLLDSLKGQKLFGVLNQNFKFIVENWSDFSNFHSQIINFAHKSIQSGGVSVYDFSLQCGLPLTPFKINSIYPLELSGFKIPFSDLEIQQTTILYEYDLIGKCENINQTLLLLIQYYKFNHQELAFNKFNSFKLNGDTIGRLEIISFFISIKGDIELLSKLLLSCDTNQSKIETLIEMVLIHSSDKGHFKSIFNYIKSFLNDEMKFKQIILKPKVIDNILLYSLKCGNAIEIFNFLINELSIPTNSQCFQDLSLKIDDKYQPIKFGNCFSMDYLKNKFNI